MPSTNGIHVLDSVTTRELYPNKGGDTVQKSLSQGLPRTLLFFLLSEDGFCELRF